ncbi:hypothetical protein [Halorubellus salinus]|uniref:hypothetical protein n=1 Tax=Halorubellus salinus TaxID=755309 RepID=UPI001D0880FF|nr:hypothetical protein [Halorubellus salinus]
MGSEETTTNTSILSGSLICFGTLLGTMPIIGLFVLNQEQSIIDRPEVLVGAALLAITITALTIYTRSDAVESIIHDADASETIWGELISYTVLLIAAFIVTSFVLIPIQTRLGHPELTSFVQLSLCTGIGLVIISLHRNKRIELPSWITAAQWGFWDHFALFGAVTALTVIYSNTVFDPTSGLLAGTGLLFGATAVLLKIKTTVDNRPNSSSTAS